MYRSPLLCAFDASGRYFVSVTADNRLKLWDIATGNLLQHFQEDKHLTASYTAIAYSLAAPTTSAQHKRKSSSSSAHSSPSLGHVALGSRSGAITLFNLTTGDITAVSSTTGKAHSSPVLTVAFHSSTTRLLSTAVDGALHTYAFPSLTLLTSTTCPASVQLLRPLQPSTDELLAAMGSALAVLDGSGGEESGVTVKKRYAPLADDIVSVDVSGDGKLFATGKATLATHSLSAAPCTAPRWVAASTHCATDEEKQRGRRSSLWLRITVECCVLKCRALLSVSPAVSVERSARAAVGRDCCAEQEEQAYPSSAHHHTQRGSHRCALQPGQSLSFTSLSYCCRIQWPAYLPGECTHQPLG